MANRQRRPAVARSRSLNARIYALLFHASSTPIDTPSGAPRRAVCDIGPFHGLRHNTIGARNPRRISMCGGRRSPRDGLIADEQRGHGHVELYQASFTRSSSPKYGFLNLEEDLRWGKRRQAERRILSFTGIYLTSWTARPASINFFSSSAVNFGGSTEMVNLSILPVNLNGTR